MFARPHVQLGHQLHTYLASNSQYTLGLERLTVRLVYYYLIPFILMHVVIVTW
jgi:hypothetical protein